MLTCHCPGARQACGAGTRFRVFSSQGARLQSGRACDARQGIPQITALDPAQPATWRMVETWLVLASARQAPEAPRRSEMYREAAARRQALAGGQDYAQLMTDLHRTADFRRARKGDLGRPAEVVNRTSQFNTTRRRSRRELLGSARHGVYVTSFRDRFGDLGLVAAVIVDRRK